MKAFTDNQQRTWQVEVNVGAVKRVKDLLKVNLLELVEGKDLLERIVGDPVFLCDLIYALCKPQADQQNITDEDFGRSMAGDAIDDATTALLEELVDFFPKARRGVFQKALVKLKTLEARAIEHAERTIASDILDRKLSEELARIDQRLEETDLRPAASGDLSGSWPESSASIPTG